uniref:Uncharacterized protein n=1 Tax=Oryza nivara TaxID=4536 RepID=A0A0E0IU94_ORYNI
MQSLAAYAAPFGSRGPTCSCLRPNPSDLQKVRPTRIPIDVDRAHMSGRCGLSNRFEWGYRSPYDFTVIASRVDGWMGSWACQVHSRWGHELLMDTSHMEEWPCLINKVSHMIMLTQS